MRQLSIAAFFFVIGAIGIYWLVTQSLSLHTFYPDTTTEFPNLLQPRALPSITPGPTLPKLSGFAQTPEPKPTDIRLPHVVAKAAQHLAPLRPLPVTAPTASLVTPMPVPSYIPVTPMPLVHTPPPLPSISVPSFGRPAGDSSGTAKPGQASASAGQPGTANGTTGVRPADQAPAPADSPSPHPRR